MSVSEAIANELATNNISPEQTTQDLARGKLSYVYRGSGRPLSYEYDSFSDVVAIRILENWDVTAKMHSNHPRPHSRPFTLSVDHARNVVRLSGPVQYWEAPATGSAMQVLNSASTGELLVKFTANMQATNDPQFTMFQGSFVYVKDVP
jgi:hypothetical protein